MRIFSLILGLIVCSCGQVQAQSALSLLLPVAEWREVHVPNQHYRLDGIEYYSDATNQHWCITETGATKCVNRFEEPFVPGTLCTRVPVPVANPECWPSRLISTCMPDGSIIRKTEFCIGGVWHSTTLVNTGTCCPLTGASIRRLVLLPIGKKGSKEMEQVVPAPEKPRPEVEAPLPKLPEIPPVPEEEQVVPKRTDLKFRPYPGRIKAEEEKEGKPLWGPDDKVAGKQKVIL